MKCEQTRRLPRLGDNLNQIGARLCEPVGIALARSACTDTHYYR